MQPATIKLFLVNGSPDGLRTAEISNWTGKAIACPRSDIKSLLEREEATNAGVYFLYGTDSETDQPAIYIGEAEVVRKRIKKHLGKDFWTSVVVIVSKDENLTKAHIRYLEGLLIEEASSLHGISLENSASSGAKLPESEKAEMDVFLDKIYQLLPVMGLGLFKTMPIQADSKNNLLYRKIKGLVATGERTSTGFVVYKGSQAVLAHRPSAVKVKGKREKLVQEGILKESGDHYIFTADIEFSSPSSAGAIISGGATNGLTAWRNKGGTTLKMLESNDGHPESEE